MYEWRSHTAEVELYVEAPTEEQVFAEAVDAFGRLIELDPGGEPASHELELEAADRGALLVNLLEELIFLADTEGFVPERAEVELGERLRVTLAGRRTEIDPLVKAATYHGLEFARCRETWQARVVLDV
jgi:SHS2 domain-containing protein